MLSSIHVSASAPTSKGAVISVITCRTINKLTAIPSHDSGTCPVPYLVSAATWIFPSDFVTSRFLQPRAPATVVLR